MPASNRWQAPDVEIVVLDNASEDGSAAAVRERFPGVRVIEQRHRAGFGANHNTVIRATTGRYVFVLNEDTTSEDWGFERMVAHLDANPRVAALGPRLVYPDGQAAGLGVALPVAGDRCARAAHARPRGHPPVGRERDARRRLGHGCRALGPP